MAALAAAVQAVTIIGLETRYTGSRGDGTISAYDAVAGTLKGTVSDAGGQPIVIPGLWGGTDSNGQSANTLFFTAGPDQQADGVCGRIDSN